MSCDKCPCGDTCLQWPIFCLWAAEEPPDPVKLAHIRARSAMGPEALRTVVAEGDRVSVAASLILTQRMNACPQRTKLPGCCTGATCELTGKVVAHLDCFACLEGDL